MSKRFVVEDWHFFWVVADTAEYWVPPDRYELDEFSTVEDAHIAAGYLNELTDVEADLAVELVRWSGYTCVDAAELAKAVYRA